MARQRRTFDEQIADLVTQGRTGRAHIMATPAMAAVEAAMIADNAVLNEHLAAGAVALENLDDTLKGTLESLAGNDEALAAAEARLTEAEARLADAFSEARNALAAAGSAQAAADSAMSTAGGKNRTYYSTSTPSGTAAVGDTWRRIDGSQNVIGEWRYAGGTTPWVSQKLTTEAISNLDVGKLTAGTAVIDDAVLQKVAAGTATIQKADIGNLTVTGSTNLNDAVARRIAANTGSFITLTTDQLTAGTAAFDTAVANKIFAETVATRKLSANNVYIGQGGNIFSGSDLTDSAWQKGTYIAQSATGGRNGGSTLTIMAAASQQGSYFGLAVGDARKAAPQLVPGSTYLFSTWVKPKIAAAVGTISAYFRLYEAADTNTTIWASPSKLSNDKAIAAGAWGRVEGAFTVPENAKGDAYGVLGLFAEAALNSEVVFSDVVLKPAVTAELIVDGTIQGKHIEANSISVDKLRISGVNAIADPTFNDAKINAERLAGTSFAAGTMSFVADDVSSANILRFTEHSDTQRSFRVGGTDDYIPVTLGDRVKMSVQYRVRGNVTASTSNIRFALYHDSATKAYIRYVGVGAYQDINNSGANWLTWEAEYTITQPDAKFIRPMVQFRNNGYSGDMEIKAPRLEVASKLSVSAPVDSGGTTMEATLGIPPGASMPGLSFTQSGPIGPPTGYQSATITSNGGTDLNLFSGKVGGNVQGAQPSTVNIGNRGITLDAGMNTGKLTITAGGGATLNGEEIMAGSPSYRARVTLTNSFTHWTGSSWNGLWVEQLGKLTIVSGAVGRATAWPAGALVATLPARFRPASKVQGSNAEIDAAGQLQIPLGQTATSFSVVYFVP